MFETDYELYLQSEHWRTFKAGILAVRRRCEKCNLANSWSRYLYGQALNVHHLTYKSLGHEKPEDVQVFCIKCHAEEHGYEPPSLFSHPRTFMQQYADQFAFPGDIRIPSNPKLHPAIARYSEFCEGQSDIGAKAS